MVFRRLVRPPFFRYPDRRTIAWPPQADRLPPGCPRRASKPTYGPSVRSEKSLDLQALRSRRSLAPRNPRATCFDANPWRARCCVGRKPNGHLQICPFSGWRVKNWSRGVNRHRPRPV
jgi:hypothetical protein